MDADDLGRDTGGRWTASSTADAATVAGDELVAMAYDVDDVAVQQDPPGLAQRP